MLSSTRSRSQQWPSTGVRTTRTYTVSDTQDPLDRIQCQCVFDDANYLWSARNYQSLSTCSFVHSHMDLHNVPHLLSIFSQLRAPPRLAGTVFASEGAAALIEGCSSQRVAVSHLCCSSQLNAIHQCSYIHFFFCRYSWICWCEYLRISNINANLNPCLYLIFEQILVHIFVDYVHKYSQILASSVNIMTSDICMSISVNI